MVETSEEAICGYDFPLQKLKVYVSSQSDFVSKNNRGERPPVGELGVASYPPTFPPLSTHCGDYSGKS
jgi:hypothetical protein